MKSLGLSKPLHLVSLAVNGDSVCLSVPDSLAIDAAI